MFATTICLLLSIAIVACDNANAVARAKQWVDAKVPYCQAANGAPDHDSSCKSTCTRPHVPAWDAYRSDCSGLVSWAWGLPAPGRTTGDFGSVSSAIQASSLQPGDAIVRPGVHIILFVSWNVQGSSANFYEEPGCSGSVNYAHAFTSAVSVSGTHITVRGKTYNAIRFSGSTPAAGSSPSSPSSPGTGSKSGSGTSSKSGSGSGSKNTCTGKCQNTSIKCGVAYVPNMCPGATNIQCCHSPITNTSAAANPQCTAIGGVCQSTSTTCSAGYTSGLCNGGSNIQCCKKSTTTKHTTTTTMMTMTTVSTPAPANSPGADNSTTPAMSPSADNSTMSGNSTSPSGSPGSNSPGNSPGGSDMGNSTSPAGSPGNSPGSSNSTSPGGSPSPGSSPSPASDNSTTPSPMGPSASPMGPSASPSPAPAPGPGNMNWNSNKGPSSPGPAGPSPSPAPAGPSPSPAPAAPAPAAPAPAAPAMGGADTNSLGNAAPAPAAAAPAPDGSTETDVQWVAGSSNYYDVVQAAPMKVTPTWKTYGKCASVEGVCQDIKNPCALSYLSFQCAGVSVPNVRCCPSKQIVDIGLDGEKWRLIPGPVTASETCKNLQFPLAPGSLQHISVNFGGKRNGGAQCHAGIDLFTRNAKKVVSMADGIVTNVIHDFVTCKCTGKPMQAGAVLVYHPSIGQTVNYAEMSTSSIAVKKGATITHGQFLGTADACCLLHIELYNGTRSEPLHWLPNKGKTAYDPDGCTHNSMDVKPRALLDPRPLINCLKPPGASLLQDAGVGGESVAQAVPAPTVNAHKPLSPGVIAAIVIVGVLVLAAIGLCIVCLLRRQRNAANVSMGGELSVKNELYSADVPVSDVSSSSAAAAATPGVVGASSSSPITSMTYGAGTMSTMMSEGTMLRRPQMSGGTFSGGTFSAGTNRALEPVGDFQCTTCGNMYQYASDLEQHRLLRHA